MVLSILLRSVTMNQIYCHSDCAIIAIVSQPHQVPNTNQDQAVGFNQNPGGNHNEDVSGNANGIQIHLGTKW